MRRPTNIELAKEAILELLDAHHATVWPEVEARLAEQPWRHLKRGINPHMLLKARGSLLGTNRIELIRGPTRGGRVVEVLAKADRPRARRAFEDAAARR
jgi:hypothetical protein